MTIQEILDILNIKMIKKYISSYNYSYLVTEYKNEKQNISITASEKAISIMVLVEGKQSAGFIISMESEKKDVLAMIKNARDWMYYRHLG